MELPSFAPLLRMADEKDTSSLDVIAAGQEKGVIESGLAH